MRVLVKTPVGMLGPLFVLEVLAIAADGELLAYKEVALCLPKL